MRIAALACVAMLAPLPAAAALSPASAAEIERLIAVLGASGCQFQRNGRWYGPERAQSHLRRKLDWLVERDMIASAEQFIVRAGTQSSISGRAYQVRCPGKEAEPSASWLQRALDAIRKRTPSSR
ncbi:DUF5329 domain-containing protein [Marilutibacter chinensis]|uniref:DUF5329 domain-containing protein n=1 Tax=Marilutibacter chinensis TaxID=2912247 RepID=A0ABS9HXP5_9GAMM|nr:DUF5329 domain-containing protein [Lysobacter chinensis]MCF7223113.1 DUF5329 domain-containing protein [Lysobacter chinensis]